METGRRPEAGGERSENSDVADPAIPPASSLQPPASITDSPWFWALSFSLFGLLMLAVMAPKYSVRQGNIETRFENRERALNWDGAEETSPEAIERARLPQAPGDRPLLISLRPIAIVLAALVAVALGVLSWRGQKQASSASEP